MAVMDAWGCWGRCWEYFYSQKAAMKTRAVGRLSRRALLWMPRTGCVSQGCSNVQAPACCPAQACSVPSPCELAAALGMLLAPGCPPSPRGPRRGHLFMFYLLYLTQAAWLPPIACREQAETFFLLSTQLSFCLGSAALISQGTAGAWSLPGHGVGRAAGPVRTNLVWARPPGQLCSQAPRAGHNNLTFHQSSSTPVVFFCLCEAPYGCSFSPVIWDGCSRPQALVSPAARAEAAALLGPQLCFSLHLHHKGFLCLFSTHCFSHFLIYVLFLSPLHLVLLRLLLPPPLKVWDSQLGTAEGPPGPPAPRILFYPFHP